MPLNASISLCKCDNECVGVCGLEVLTRVSRPHPRGWKAPSGPKEHRPPGQDDPSCIHWYTSVSSLGRTGIVSHGSKLAKRVGFRICFTMDPISVFGVSDVYEAVSDLKAAELPPVAWFTGFLFSQQFIILYVGFSYV